MSWLFFAIPAAFFFIWFMVDSSRISENKKRMEERRRIQDSYYAKTSEDYPEAVGNYYKPNRAPIEKSLRPKILNRTNGYCFYCDKELDPFDWQIDHVWPYRMGGTHEFVNLVPACKDCNEEKWAHLPTTYLLKKWALGGSFTKHEKNFIEYHRTHSMSDLIATSAHWKSRADYIKDYHYAEFADLVLTMPSIVSQNGDSRERLIIRTKKLMQDLDAPSLRRGSNGRFYTDQNDIRKWIELHEMMRDFKRD
jgi:5-methylcytosine-specific restriction endonuclease McrA